jgi:uncharacterized membrane protein YeaQ/YmgE (transglycosylase-associated protein family)
MNIATWILAGGIIGWIAFSLLKFNAGRGMIISVIIGVAGAVAGGDLLAPLLSTAIASPGDFNPLSLFTAAASAAGCLIVGDMVHSRFGV